MLLSDLHILLQVKFNFLQEVESYGVYLGFVYNIPWSEPPVSPGDPHIEVCVYLFETPGEVLT
jgi:hypothetical protein